MPGFKSVPVLNLDGVPDAQGDVFGPWTQVTFGESVRVRVPGRPYGTADIGQVTGRFVDRVTQQVRVDITSYSGEAFLDLKPCVLGRILNRDGSRILSVHIEGIDLSHCNSDARIPRLGDAERQGPYDNVQVTLDGKPLKVLSPSQDVVYVNSLDVPGPGAPWLNRGTQAEILALKNLVDDLWTQVLDEDLNAAQKAILRDRVEAALAGHPDSGNCTICGQRLCTEACSAADAEDDGLCTDAMATVVAGGAVDSSPMSLEAYESLCLPATVYDDVEVRLQRTPPRGLFILAGEVSAEDVERLRAGFKEAVGEVQGVWRMPTFRLQGSGGDPGRVLNKEDVEESFGACRAVEAPGARCECGSASVGGPSHSSWCPQGGSK